MERLPEQYPFCPLMAQVILEHVMAGETLKSICGLKGFAPRSAVLRWLATNPEFEARYFRAREVAMEAMADDLLSWAGEGLLPDLKLLVIEPTLGQITQAHRTRVAVKQWLMAHWAPKTYGGRTVAREDRAEVSAAAPALPPVREPDPAASPRISPRAFTIPPIASDAPITIGSLKLPKDLGAHDLDARSRPAGDTESPAAMAPPSAPTLRPSRHRRRAMAAMARNRPADLAPHSRAPPP
jgi:hypothetical protein